MKRWNAAVLAALLVSGPVCAASATLVPAASGEQLRYSVNWPSGLALGEFDLSASRSGADTGQAARLSVSASLDASIPGYQMSDKYKSEATGAYCSTRLEKSVHHGSRASEETDTFDLANGTLTRQTKDGGKSDLSVSKCPMDALAFIYFLRNELANGRLPQPQDVYFGAPYHVRLDFGGAQKIKAGGQMVDADRITAAVRGPASDFTVEIFFAHDAVRTPVLIRVPVSVGTISAELMR